MPIKNFFKALKLRVPPEPRPIIIPEDDRLTQLLGYSNPYAASQPIEPSPANPVDFIDVDLAPFKHMFDAPDLHFDADEIRSSLQKDTAPIPAKINREDYCDDHLTFWLSGYFEFGKLAAMAAKYGITGGSYFDFGGSTGRLFRHFHFQSNEWDVWSSDFKMTSVEWNIENYPSDIAVFQNTYFPFLPIEDSTFDLITAMSVFTHIDETETTWLMELRRILKPGAIAIVTIHNEDTWLNMQPALREVIEEYSPELAANPTLPSGRSVSTWRRDDPYRCNTFHSNDYIETQWSRFFEIMDIIPQASGMQAAVILRKPIKIHTNSSVTASGTTD